MAIMFDQGRLITIPDEIRGENPRLRHNNRWIGVDMARSGRDFTALFEGNTSDTQEVEIPNTQARQQNQRRYVSFAEWISGIKRGFVGKQSGNTRQDWIYTSRTRTFSQVNSTHGSTEKDVSEEEMSRRFGVTRRNQWLEERDELRRILPEHDYPNRFWVEGPITNKKQRKTMYKYGLKKHFTLETYQSRYRGIDPMVMERIYKNPGSLEVNHLIADGTYKTEVMVEGDSKHFYVADLELVETPLEEDMRWSNVRNRTLNFIGDHLLEQIRTRYAFFDRPTNGLSNIIIDNYAPKLMYNTRFQPGELPRLGLPKTIYAISPWFAQYFGAQQVPTEQLCRILGYDVKTLKQMIVKIKHRAYSISFVGYGGTNVNTIHWLTEIMKMTQSVNLFKFIEIYEPDTAEISNLLRFPKNPYIEHNHSTLNILPRTSKLKLLDPAEIALLSKERPVLSRERVDGRSLPYDSKGTYYEQSTRRKLPKDNHIYYGAPNIDTRASFEDIGHFISATHNGNDAHLWLNPAQDTDLQVESYGLIQLTPFFMNQLRLAIGLLELLCADDVDFKAKDQCLLEYSFDGTVQLPTNKTYNFQLGSHRQTVATEEEANMAW